MVNTVEDLVNWEQLNARGFFTDVEHPAMGSVKIPTAAYRFSRTPVSYGRAAPLLGEHNGQILGGRLGHSGEELSRMRGCGII